MKKLFLFVIISLCFTVISFSQENDETTVKNIINEANNKITHLEQKQGQEVVNLTIDNIGKDVTKHIYRYLDPSFDYNVMILTDNRIANIKLVVNKPGTSSWELVNEKSGVNPVISLNPEEVGEYQFSINAESWNGNNTAGHFALILYHAK